MSVEKISVESKQDFEQMLAKEMDQIERDLTVICSGVQINDKSTLDILCHDNNGQLVIMQLNVSEDDSMLIQGMQSLDYVDKFKSFLKATYSKHKIDDKMEPRLVLVAPRFSDALQHAVKHMHGIRIDLYEWEYLKLGDHKALRLQPIFAWQASPQTDQEKPFEKKRESKSSKKKETEEKEEPMPEPPPEPQPTEDQTTPVPEQPAEEEQPFKPYKEESQPQKKKLKLF